MMGIDNYSEIRKIRIYYICACVFLVAVFLTLLYRPILTIFHETDLWWMIPTQSYIADNSSFFGALKTLVLNPYLTNFVAPEMNVYIFLILSSLGSQAKYFIFTSILIHFCCSIFLYLIVRKIDLDFRIAFFAALTYLTMFIHFHYYIWPMAAQHLIVVFFVFLVLCLYLETTRRLDSGVSWRQYFRLTLFVNILASFCQIAILILPASILTHILTCSKNGAERIKKYDIWLPFFITYLGYPLIRLVYINSHHLENYFHIPIMKFSSIGLYPTILMLGVGSLFLFRYALELYHKYRPWKFLRNLFITIIILYFFMFLVVSGKKELLSPLHRSEVVLSDFLTPYNFLHPFIIMLNSFLQPLKVALLTSSAKPYYYISTQPGIIGILLSLFLIFIFIKKYLIKYKGLILFFLFYFLALRFMWMRDSIQSRYFVYITPFFAVMFCAAFVYLYFFLINKIRLKKIIQEIILLSIFMCLFISNISAIKLEMLRGRLVNTFFIYDYIRTADIIKYDIATHNFSKHFEPNRIYINGIFTMPSKEYWDSCPADPLKFDTFRYTLSQVFNDSSMSNVNVNQLVGQVKENLVYTIKDSRIDNAQGINIDRFCIDFNQAVNELRLGRNEKATVLFQKAIERRPFLLNYVLLEYNLEDLKWITGGKDMRTWIGDIVSYYNSWGEHPIEKTIHISTIMNNEIDEYIECLFYSSYLKYLSGEIEESKYLFSRIQFLEDDYNTLSSWLSERPLIRSDARMLSFLDDMNIEMPHDE